MNLEIFDHAALRGRLGAPLRHVVALVLIALATGVSYSSSLRGTWAMDDLIVSENVRPSGEALVAETVVRRVTNVSFALNRALGPDVPANYRLGNVAVHLLTTFVLYWLVWATMRRGRFADRLAGHASWVPFLSAAVFALHPININAVAYIIQRAAALATLFTLLALLTHLYATLSTSRGIKIALHVLSAASICLAIFSKENGVVAVPLLLLYDGFFLGAPAWRGRRSRFALVAAVAGAALIVADRIMHLGATAANLLRIYARYDAPVPPLAWTAVDAEWTPLEHVLTAGRVVMRYLAVIVVPLPRWLVFDWWGFPLSRDLLHPITTLVSLLALVGMVVLALWWRRRWPWLAFGALWYLIAVSLESFVAVGSDLYFEHRNYLPMAGLAFGAVGQAFVWAGDHALRRRLLAVVGIVACAGLGLATFQRNHVWTDSLTLWKDTVEKAPENLRAKLYYAFFLSAVGEGQQSELLFRQVLEETGSRRRSLMLTIAGYNLGLTYLLRGQPDAARDIIDRLETGELEGSHKRDILKGLSAAARGDAPEAMRIFDRVIASASARYDQVAGYVFGADVRRRNRQFTEAIDGYVKALQLEPGFTPARYGLAMAYREKGDVERAYLHFRELLRLDPHHVDALCEMADVMMIKKQPRLALDYARRASTVAPRYARPYLAFGNGLLALGRAAEAQRYYRAAASRGLSWSVITFNQGNVLVLAGDRAAARARFTEVADNAEAPPALRAAARERLASL